MNSLTFSSGPYNKGVYDVQSSSYSPETLKQYLVQEN